MLDYFVGFYWKTSSQKLMFQITTHLQKGRRVNILEVLYGHQFCHFDNLSSTLWYTRHTHVSFHNKYISLLKQQIKYIDLYKLCSYVLFATSTFYLVVLQVENTTEKKTPLSKLNNDSIEQNNKTCQNL